MTSTPILLAENSVNQRLPSGPGAMLSGLLLEVVTKNSVITPAVVMRPIRLASYSVNQRLPSGPAVMSKLRVVESKGNSVITPAVVMRPILPAPNSVNQSAPSEPAAIPSGVLLEVGMEYSVTVPAVVTRP